MYYFLLLFVLITNAEATKRQREFDGSKSHTKRELNAILQGMRGWEGNRAGMVRHQGATIHGSNRIEHDTMEYINEKFNEAIRILGEVLATGFITGWIATIEYWQETTEITHQYLQRFNYHIHLFWIASQYATKPEWHHWYKNVFGSILGKLDHCIDSMFHMTTNELYGISYCVAYLFKRFRFFMPKYGGICNPINIKEWLEQHKQNPIEYQVDYGKEAPEGVDRYAEPNMIAKGALIFINRLFHINGIKWRRSIKELTYIWDDAEFDYTHFCIVLSNKYRDDYGFLLDNVFKRLKRPEYFFLKYKQV